MFRFVLLPSFDLGLAVPMLLCTCNNVGIAINVHVCKYSKGLLYLHTYV